MPRFSERSKNSLGQLIKVIEDPGGLNYITEYSYNALGKLTQVYQKGNNSSDTQTRFFDYDSLGRLLESDNPEASDTTVYAYDDAGNMTSKTDARNVTTTVTYDALNRVSVKSYSDGTPTAIFCYDGKVRSGGSCVTPGTAIPFSIGRLTVSNNGYNQRIVNAFDAMGRVLSETQSTVTMDSPWTVESYPFSYTYNRNGTLASQTYPSGKVINYTYDTNNRPDVVAESGGESFILSRRFADHGGAEETQYGNFLRQKYCYNDRLQMTGTELSPHSTPYGVEVDCVQIASNLITLNFDYGSANQNNGNIVSQTIEASADDVWQQYYTYDGANRLAMASENAAISGSTCPGGATWCRKYGYDHFGNRWIASSLDTLHMATPTAQSAVSLATNRLTSGTYDAAGNLTAQTYITTGGGSMAYDANNKMKSFTATGVSVSTQYDAAGRRVRKIHNGQTTIWVYDAFGKLAAEYSTENQPTPVGTYYRTTDPLGSTRLVTDDLGRVRQRHDFFPFGEQIPASASFGNRQNVIDGGFATYNASLSVRQQFTGQQRDAETGLDYFWARNMAAPLGRFLSMDPSNAGASHGSPQSWNAFGYVSNNPLRMVDPDGRCGADVSIVYRDAYGNPIGFDFSQSEACFTVDVWDTAANNGDMTRLYFPDELEYCQTFGCDPYDYCYGNCSGESGTWGGAPPQGGGGGSTDGGGDKIVLPNDPSGLGDEWSRDRSAAAGCRSPSRSFS